MGALSFKARFCDAVLAGLKKEKGGKRQSIRNFRKRPLKPGEHVSLYYAQRTKYCTLLGKSLIISRNMIRIDEDTIFVMPNLIDHEFSLSNCWYKTKSELNRFARADGFKDFEDMKAFWIAKHGKEGSPFPYVGHLYKW